ncbi:winged helix-turn-helix transcriptional regulator [Actinomadura graeca]|uniref:Winged helix-turn-helix transcriptional regulator n=1 Tax=Actinomadura graeca TaxID=2750812 RepID=A0ABX8QR79_9ACTN|nr:MarR family winged helix-turn-helix transcriptional regulator [Actinomadura graeca]QXJ20936.1 winged helix-turn-helix transcriptional regulator [Actinomadura graeca]
MSTPPGEPSARPADGSADGSADGPADGRGPGDPPGFELPLRLFLAFRVIIDELHEELAREGHPGLRPMHGFVFQAIGPGGTTAVELGRRLGVSKQAAGKMIESLERAGYVERAADPSDARRKIVRLTARGTDSLVRSARIFDRIRDRWAARLGADRLRALETGLRELTPADVWRLDVPGWFGTG